MAPGRQGLALDAARAGLEISRREAYGKPPFTVELWVRLQAPENLLIEFPAHWSREHWQITTEGREGKLCVTMYRHSPCWLRGLTPLADDHWHYVVMTFDGHHIGLHVDGRDDTGTGGVDVKPSADPLAPTDEPLWVGTPVSPGYGETCTGLIEEVRLSDCIRPIDGIPSAPLAPDGHTVGLWRIDTADPGGLVPDLSRQHNPARIRVLPAVYLDEVDRACFHPGPAPVEGPVETVALKPGSLTPPAGPPVLLLDGVWEMGENGSEEERLHGAWTDAIPATVPGSVHTALEKAGRIPDPKFGRNDRIAHDKSFSTWWFKRTFPRPVATSGERLRFDGVANRCTVWLNGTQLGVHAGMFGGPTFDIAALLCDINTLVVRVDPAPGRKEDWSNSAWRQTVTFNNSYGWHYSSIAPIGIWRSVRVEGAPAVRLRSPFMVTRDALRGAVDLVVDLEGAAGGWAGELRGTVAPENFTGTSCSFVLPVSSNTAARGVHVRFEIPAPRPWWPNGIGEPNLYQMALSFTPTCSQKTPDAALFTFGLRTVVMEPIPGRRPNSKTYKWTFVINGRPVFVNGTGWCTMDSSMDFSRERYDRFLSLARDQHCQMLRAWGAGMPETDDFYDLCDRYGLMVMQEWPTAWSSHALQPYALLEETVRLNTLRLRNRPSLVMWGAGNETQAPYGPAIDMMGRLAVELDGTRPFHRGEPYGGSQHNYDVWWGKQHIERTLELTADFYGEFGVPCLPVLESVQRYLPAEERNLWPPPPDGSLAHHTPIFGKNDDLAQLGVCAGYFTEARTMERFIVGTQLAQVTGVRHVLERARTRWPQCAGALMYKLNDNYPAASWSTVDWYGAPKIGHYFVQDAFAPLHACAILPSFNCAGKDTALPIFLLDDADVLNGHAWEVEVRAFDQRLRAVKRQAWSGRGMIGRVRQVGEFALTAEETASHPLLVVVDLRMNGKAVGRTFYWQNFEAARDCLFMLPRTTLRLEGGGPRVTVTNTGSLPAVAVEISRSGHGDTFAAEDNFFWLDAGERRTVATYSSGRLKVTAWNA
jgi:beta-mannosidase